MKPLSQSVCMPHPNSSLVHIVASQNAVLEATDELRAHVLVSVAYLTYQRVRLNEAHVQYSTLILWPATVFNHLKSNSIFQNCKLISHRFDRQLYPDSASLLTPRV